MILHWSLDTEAMKKEKGKGVSHRRAKKRIVIVVAVNEKGFPRYTTMKYVCVMSSLSHTQAYK